MLKAYVNFELSYLISDKGVIMAFHPAEQVLLVRDSLQAGNGPLQHQRQNFLRFQGLSRSSDETGN
jgi:hypothetical protein